MSFSSIFVHRPRLEKRVIPDLLGKVLVFMNFVDSDPFRNTKYSVMHIQPSKLRLDVLS